MLTTLTEAAVAVAAAAGFVTMRIRRTNTGPVGRHRTGTVRASDIIAGYTFARSI